MKAGAVQSRFFLPSVRSTARKSLPVLIVLGIVWIDASASGATSPVERAEWLVALAAFSVLAVALLVLGRARPGADSLRPLAPADKLGGIAEREDGASSARELTPDATRHYSDFVISRRLLSEARPYWKHIALVFLLSILATPAALLLPLPLKIAVDSVIGSDALPDWLDRIVPEAWTGSDASVLVLAAGLLIFVVLLTEFTSLGSSVMGTYTAERLLLRFRSRLFGHVQRLSVGYHDTQGTADATYRVQYDTMSIQSIVVFGVAPLLTSIFTLAGMIYVTARLDLQLALVALAITPVLFALTWASRSTLREGWRETKQLESAALSVVQEVLTGLRVVKAFGREEHEESRFARRSGEGMRARIRISLIEGAYGLGIGLVIAAGTAAVLYIGVRHVQAGALTLGSLLLVMTYLTQLYAPLKSISKNVAKLQSAFAGAERVFALLDQEPDVPERRDARPLDRARGAVAFDRVSFAYADGPLVLRQLSFAVEAGTRVGIAGTTGAGKTTLVNLLTRFYDPVEGRIVLDGCDLRDYRLVDLRAQFGIVLQEPVLFSTSIAENIAYARPDADEVEIIAAAKAANAHDFIRALPDEYETVVGERGMRLSGGERQRISLARAFLKDAPILILDEPTSSVDVKTEAVIMEAMERLMRGRTTFMIAHRLSTLNACDVVLEIEDGRIAALERDPARRITTLRARLSEARQALA